MDNKSLDTRASNIPLRCYSMSLGPRWIDIFLKVALSSKPLWDFIDANSVANGRNLFSGLVKFIELSKVFFSKAANRQNEFIFLISGMKMFSFLSMNFLGNVKRSPTVYLDFLTNDILPIQFLDYIVSQTHTKRVERSLNICPIPPPSAFAYCSSLQLVSDSGNSWLLQSDGILAFSDRSIILSCRDDCGAKFSLKFIPLSHPDVASLEREAENLKVLANCSGIQNFVGIGIVQWGQESYRGLLADVVGTPLYHLPLSSFSIDQYRALWIAVKSVLKELRDHAFIHGDIKPNHFILDQMVFFGSLTLN